MLNVDGYNIKPIPGFEDRYAISRNGDIWSIKRNVCTHGVIHETHKPYKLKPSKDKAGYLVVSLYNGSGHKSKKVHNLVAVTFLSNPEKKKCACHKDNNKENCSVDNLYWGTDSENLKQAWDDDLFKTRTPVKQMNLNGDIISIFASQADAAKMLNIHQQNISKCVNGKSHTAGGFKWQKLV